MKQVYFSLPFALFMMIGASSPAFSSGLSAEATNVLSQIAKTNTSTDNNSDAAIFNNGMMLSQYQPNYAQQPQNQQQAIQAQNAVARVGGKCPEHYSLGIPQVVSSDRDKIERRSFYLCRIGYAVQFDPATKTPLWSAEKLNSRLLVGAKDPRSDDFRPDPEVPNGAQATLNDYKGSHFDRGHNTPAADQTGRGAEAMSESFYLTNMFPQVGPNQNRGIWADLEAQVRDWTQQRGELLVVTGPIFDTGTLAIGRSKVWVPTRLYKVVIDPKTLESIAFIMPNRQIITRKTRQLDKGGEYPQTQPEQAVNCNGQPCSLENFVVPVSAVEQATGLRFFSALQPNIHDQTVQRVSNNWRMR